MDRQDLLRPSVPKDNSKLRLITNFNPNNPDLRSLLKKYEDILLLTRKPAVKPEDIQVTYNKSPSIRDMKGKNPTSQTIYTQDKPTLSQTQM